MAHRQLFLTRYLFDSLIADVIDLLWNQSKPSTEQWMSRDDSITGPGGLFGVKNLSSILSPLLSSLEPEFCPVTLLVLFSSSLR